MFSEDTIAAPATVPGTGAVSVIRVSGPDAFSVADKVVTIRRGTLSSSEGYTIHFGTVSDTGGALLDEVVVAVFRAPHSYTGEDSIEITCHASSYIVSEIMTLLCNAGARPAQAGEFTKRAFINGKMDLSQAESVADLIASEDRASHRIAISQMRGGYSEKLDEIRSGLLEMTALMELELDFSEEDVEFADRKRLLGLVENAISHVDALASSFRLGNVIKNGVPVAIAGDANTGKSTLLNALLGEERAIVSDIAGTTRDTIEETLNIDGIKFRFIDTAGIRETSETIEKIGIDRTFRKISEAEIVLALVDVTKDFEAVRTSLDKIISCVDTSSQKLFVIVNKCDEIEELPENYMAKQSVNKKVNAIYNYVSSIDNQIVCVQISAKHKIGLDALRTQLSASQKDRISASCDSILVTNLRHYNALTEARTSLLDVHSGLTSGSPSDLVAQDLRAAIDSISSILGKSITVDETLGVIFERFCIGK